MTVIPFVAMTIVLVGSVSSQRSQRTLHRRPGGIGMASSQPTTGGAVSLAAAPSRLGLASRMRKRAGAIPSAETSGVAVFEHLLVSMALRTLSPTSRGFFWLGPHPVGGGAAASRTALGRPGDDRTNIEFRAGTHALALSGFPRLATAMIPLHPPARLRLRL